MRTITSNLKAIIAIVPASLFIIGCETDANLIKVREFSQNAEQLEQTLPVIANDFYQSCLREAQYRPIVTNSINSSSLDSNPSSNLARENVLLTIENLIDGSNNESSNLEIKQSLEELVEKLKQEQSVTRRNAQKECNEKSKDRAQPNSVYLGSLMKEGNSIITLYMKKLGTLADDNSLNFDNEFNSLSTNLITLNTRLEELFINIPADSSNFQAQSQLAQQQSAKRQQQITAGTSIANFIVNQIFKGKRIETLNEAIANANEPLKNYTEALQTIVQRVYIDQYLRTEESSLDGYYSDYLIDILDEYEAAQDGLSKINFASSFINLDRDRWQPEKQKIQERRELAYSYINLLQTIINGHEQLAVIYRDNRQPSQVEVKEIIDSNSIAVKEFVTKAKALEKSDLTEKNNHLIPENKPNSKQHK